jgi:hypothetical protein
VCKFSDRGTSLEEATAQHAVVWRDALGESAPAVQIFSFGY